MYPGDDLVVDFEDPVTLLEPYFLGRPAGNHLDYGRGVVRHVELDPDAVEFAGKVGLRLIELHRRHVHGVGIQGGKCGDDGRLADFLVVDRVDIILVDLVKDQVELAPLPVLHVYHVLLGAVGVVCRDGQGTDDDAQDSDQDGGNLSHVQSTFSTSIPARRRRSTPSVRRYSSLYTTLLMPAWIISFEHSRHGEAVT